MATATDHRSIELDDNGEAGVAGTRIKVMPLVEQMIAWELSMEQLRAGFPHLSPAQLRPALDYYREPSDEIDRQIARVLADHDTSPRAAWPQDHAPIGTNCKFSASCRNNRSASRPIGRNCRHASSKGVCRCRLVSLYLDEHVNGPVADRVRQRDVGPRTAATPAGLRRLGKASPAALAAGHCLPPRRLDRLCGHTYTTTQSNSGGTYD